MGEVTLLAIVFFVCLVTWWRSGSIIVAGMVGFFLLTIFNIDFNRSVQKLKELDSMNFELKLEEKQVKQPTTPSNNDTEVNVKDFIREHNIEMKHITGRIREVEVAHLFKVGENEYTMRTPDGQSVTPDDYLRHSDGRLFACKQKHCWPIGE